MPRQDIGVDEREARRKGKKVAVHTSSAIPGTYVKIDIRMDGDGKFHARYLDVWYDDATMDGLKAALDEVVAKQGPTSWEYVIEVDDVDFEEEARDRRYGGYGWASRDKIKIDVDYRVVKLSNVLKGTEGGYDARGKYTDKVNAYRLKKKVTVNEDGTLEDEQDQRKEVVDSVDEEDLRTRVPYTPERWASLEAIAAAARELGRRMAKTLNAKNDQVAAFLDVDPAQGALARLALPAAPEVIPPKKKASRS